MGLKGKYRRELRPDIVSCVAGIDAKTQELVWRGVVQDTVNGIGQTEKQANSAAKDLVKRFLKDAKRTNKAG
jgi:hypothetical protein